MDIVTEISRIFIPIVSVVIIIKCILTLWLGHPKDKIYGYFTDLSKNKKYELGMWETSIGKTKTNDIVLPYEDISRSQIVIARRYDSWYVHDLKSKNGTRLNGKAIKDKAPIDHGDIITFSGHDFRFTVADDPVVREKRKKGQKKASQKKPQQTSPKPAPKPQASTQQRKVSSPVLYNMKTGESLNLTGTSYILGTGKGSSMKIASPYVSARHAKLQLYEDGWAIEDLGSRNGSTLNKKKLTSPQLLFNGDVVELADEKFKYKA